MDLPKLHPGKRYTLPRPVGSADALLLAQLGLREKSQNKLTAIVTANTTGDGCSSGNIHNPLSNSLPQGERQENDDIYK